jgi:hypothetical protein
MSTEKSETELAQDLDTAFAAYQRRYGRPRAMDRLRLMLMRAYEAQRVLDETTGADDHWKRIGEEARKQTDQFLGEALGTRKAAE